MKTYRDEVKTYLTAKGFWIPMLVLAVLSYGFAIYNTSIGIDDLEIDRYVGAGHMMLLAGRMGIQFWGAVATRWATAYTLDILALMYFVLAVVNLCILFQRVSGNAFRMEALTVFGCLMVTNPLILEIWEYTGAMHHICGSLLLMSWVLLWMQGFIRKPQKAGAWRVILSSLLMLLVCSGYESIVSVYIFFVFAILGLQVLYGTEKDKKVLEMVRQGLIYAAVLAAGLILRLIAHRLVLAILGQGAVTNGDTLIRWMEIPAKEVLRELLVDGILQYILKAVIYYPIAQLLTALAVLLVMTVAAGKKRGWSILLPAAGMLLSLVILSLVQGSLSPYRTCQAFWAVIALTGMGLTQWILNGGRKALAKGVTVFMACVCLYNAFFLNYFLTQNLIRSKEEEQILRTVGMELRKANPEDKPVVFLGRFRLSEGITEAVSVPEDSPRWRFYYDRYMHICYALGLGEREYYMTRHLPQSNVNSVIQWGIEAYGQEGIQHLLTYYGYPVEIGDNETLYPLALRFAEENEMPGYPYEGYIRDAGDFMVVSLKNCPW